MRGRDLRLEDGLDFDLLAERRAKQLCDIEDGAVDVDIARLQRLLAGEGEQMLDQLGAAFRRLIDQGCRLQQLRLVLQARHQRFGGAGDHGEHVVEIMRDAAGELADGVELLRLLQLALGFARGGDVVIDHGRAADGPGGVAQRAARDHEMKRIAAVRLAYDDFQAVELLAAHRAHRRRFVLGQFRGAVGSVRDVLCPQLIDGHVQMLGALGDRGFKRLVYGLGGAQRNLQPAARAPRLADQNNSQHQDQRHAGEIDRQKDTSGEPGLRGSNRKQPLLRGGEPVEIRFQRRHRGAALRLGAQRRQSRGIAGCLQPQHFAAHREPLGDKRFALSEQSRAVGIIPGRLDQLGECRRDAADGGVVFVQELRVAVEGKTARRALRLPNQ